MSRCFHRFDVENDATKGSKSRKHGAAYGCICDETTSLPWNKPESCLGGIDTQPIQREVKWSNIEPADQPTGGRFWWPTAAVGIDGV
ncbi:unnamed protein product [Nippostrongylus brasiliensis]|uniref:Uncharacterized protein n=1 Tax=Nippostrongylus brasiliensis TaxID=27835 RepID=A0A0N4YGI8_NIPBR|nr:hypothetical protein Q1695_001933 [Nippostrongylus brasiliensis]VDL79521.1 unnamed protein product [Nippostrongylus brasiliensis]